MNGLHAAAVLLMGMAVTDPACTDSPATVDQLTWLSGSWAAEHEGRWTEEHWTAPRGGLMLGGNRAGRGDLARSFEFMRIQADADGVVTYWAMPGGGEAVPFKLTGHEGHSATFENPAHDFPTRIRYRRNGDTLEATISGADGAGAMSWQWTRRPD